MLDEGIKNQPSISSLLGKHIVQTWNQLLTFNFDLGLESALLKHRFCKYSQLGEHLTKV